MNKYNQGTSRLLLVTLLVRWQTTYTGVTFYVLNGYYQSC